MTLFLEAGFGRSEPCKKHIAAPTSTWYHPGNVFGRLRGAAPGGAGRSVGHRPRGLLGAVGIERHGPDYDARSVPYWSVVELMGAWDMAGLSRARQIVYQTSAGTVRVLVCLVHADAVS
ncbi:hypothetical protein AOLI_G00327040 [Acnodon oligacanthus]